MARNGKRNPRIPRRDFLKASAASVAAIGTMTSEAAPGQGLHKGKPLPQLDRTTADTRASATAGSLSQWVGLVPA